MAGDDELSIVRRVYARQVVHAAEADDPRLQAALATVRREDFLPPPPWRIMKMPGGYLPAVDDPIFVY